MTTIHRINQALECKDASWGYHHMMGDQERRQMDAELVSIGHPLGFEPGTNESRFKTLHKAGFRFADR